MGPRGAAMIRTTASDVSVNPTCIHIPPVFKLELQFAAFTFSHVWNNHLKPSKESFVARSLLFDGLQIYTVGLMVNA
jgi:hypothetical protein